MNVCIMQDVRLDGLDIPSNSMILRNSSWPPQKDCTKSWPIYTLLVFCLAEVRTIASDLLFVF